MKVSQMNRALFVTLLRVTPTMALTTSLLVASAFVLVSVAAADQPRRTITVQGTGVSGAVPDLAQVSAGALTRASTATKALAENNAVVGNVLALVADFDIPDRDVRTSGFSLTPNFERQQQRGNNAKAPTIIGYQVSNNISIKVPSINKLGNFLDKLTSVGANQIRGISFGLSDRNSLQNDARRGAISDARAKATLYANEAGVALGDVLEIIEAGISLPRPLRAEASILKAGAAVPIAVGTLEVRANITMRFAIADE